MIRLRVLVAFEDDYRVYGEVIVSAIRSTRSHLDVAAVAGIRDLEAEVARFDPHLVISSSRQPPLLSGQHSRLSWVELSVDPNRPSLICIDGHRWESFNPSLQELLDVVDETELVLVGASQQTGEGAC